MHSPDLISLVQNRMAGFGKKRHIEDERSFPNPYLEDKACNLPGELDVEKVPPELAGRLKDAIVSNVYLICQASPSRDQSVYTGSTGIALLHYHLATSLYNDSPSDSSKHLQQAAKLLQPSLSHLDAHRFTFLCGAGGPLALGAVVYAKLGESTTSKQCIDSLRELYARNKTTFPELPSELLYGHAGYLYSLLFVNHAIPGAIEESLVTEVVETVLSCGEKGREDQIQSPMMYTWHHKHYLGAAHGLVGILTLLLQVPIDSLKPRIHALVKPCVDYLLSIRLASGNLPSSLESSVDDRLVHWCHGAPGAVHLFARAYKVFGTTSYLDAAVQCGEVVWRRGMLRKGYGLCHGTAGNAYTFLQLYRVTGQKHHLQRAIKFTEWCLSSSERQCHNPDTPYSLFEGLAGITYYYSDVCSGAEKALFPALELSAH